ncbi:conserved hypothetical protein [delta proteobacterium NaphS2]|nr:conserved hypothetical protein [delta proteobacterium NaphS2]
MTDETEKLFHPDRLPISPRPLFFLKPDRFLFKKFDSYDILY